MKLIIDSCNRCGHTPNWKWGYDIMFEQEYMIYDCPECRTFRGGSITVKKVKNKKKRVGKYDY